MVGWFDFGFSHKLTVNTCAWLIGWWVVLAGLGDNTQLNAHPPVCQICVLIYSRCCHIYLFVSACNR